VKKIFGKIRWSGLTIIALFIIIYTYAIVKKSIRLKNPTYVKGTSLGISKGVRGSLYLYYSFQVNNQSYKGNVTNDFCKTCSACCDSGNAVIVRYQKGNPENNDLVTDLPSGTSLEDDQ